ncbi:autotransporter domain-containing protein, partial [Akkermansia muciniphila]
MGAAFTANYGDLTASAADSADGHLDSYYASLFGRYQDRRWAHTLILTGGWNDAKLNRTVNYGE